MNGPDDYRPRVKRIVVEYWGGPLDGIVEEVRASKACIPMIIGEVGKPPEGFYAGVRNGRRPWRQRIPSWMKPK